MGKKVKESKGKVAHLFTQLCETKTNYRPYMEDYSFVYEIFLKRIGQVGIFGICDGHGGSQVSDFVSKNMKKVLQVGLSDLTENQFLNKPFMTKILINCFAILESRLENTFGSEINSVGSTCSMVLLSRPLNAWYAINCGDSSVLGIQVLSPKVNNAANLDQTGQVKISRITRLHKPDLEDEEKRIEKAGGFVANYAGVPRLCGVLAVSRSFGDCEQRPFGMTETPEIYGPLNLLKVEEGKGTSINPKDVNGFFGFIICSDGISDFITEKEIQTEYAKNFDNRHNFASYLIENTDSQDNASVICAYVN